MPQPFKFALAEEDIPEDGHINCEIGYPKNEANPHRKPLAYQRKFHTSKAKYRLMSGGFGTGGTTALAIECVYQLLTYPNNVGLLGRHNSVELESTTLTELLDILPEVTIKRHDRMKRIIYLWNGSKLIYMGLDSGKGAVDKIKSLNLGFACIDQVEEIDEVIFLAIQGRLRRQESERCFFAKCNPEGHNWAWERWVEQPLEDYLIINDISKFKAQQVVKLIEHAQNDNKIIDKVIEMVAESVGVTVPQALKIYEKEQYAYFGAITTDNHYLPPEYVNNLIATYPEKWLRRYVYNSWDNFEGLVYSEFQMRKNIETAYVPDNNDAHIFMMDYGYRNPTCILYVAIDSEGIVHIYDEYYQAEKLISDHARDLKSNKHWKKADFIADPSISKTERDGGSVKDTWNEDHDIWWDSADNDVRQGIDRVNEYLKKGLIKISKRCVNLLSEIGKYKWKELKVGEIKNEYEEPVKKDDHAMDCLRYLVNKIYIPEMKTEESIAREFAIELYGDEEEGNYDESSY
jgi:PBSX family phage terminase large subunit